MMIPRSLPCFLLLTFLYLTGSAQQGNNKLIGRLEQAWTIAESQPARALSIADSIEKIAFSQNIRPLELSAINAKSNFQIYLRHYASAKVSAQLGLKKADQYLLKQKKGVFYNTLGLIFYTKGDYESAADQYGNAGHIFEQNKELSNTATALLNVGMAYRKLSRFQQANQSYFRAAEIFSNINDKESLAGTYQSIGNVFDAWGRFREALSYYRLGTNTAKKVKDKSLLAQGLNNTGYAYIQLKLPDSALLYLLPALEIRKKEPRANSVLLLQNLASAWRLKEESDKASKILLESISIATQNHMQDELLRGILDYAELLNGRKQYSQALKYTSRAESLAAALKSDDLRLKSLRLSSNALQGLNNYRSALKIEGKIDQLQSMIFSQAESRALKELEIRYQTLQRETKISSLEKEQNLGRALIAGQKKFIVFLISSALILILLLVFVIRLYLDKKHSAKKIQVLNHELHHRVKNNLQILASLFNLQLAQAENEQVKKNIWENELRVNAMNLIHSQLQQNDQNTLINLQFFLTELAKNVKLSLGPQGKQVELTLNIQPIKINADKAVALGLMVNEILTNAFKYALKNNHPEISLTLNRKDSDIELKIKDNGTGFSPQQTLSRNSFGLKLISIMADQLSAKMMLESSDGTSYQFLIPVSSLPL